MTTKDTALDAYVREMTRFGSLMESIRAAATAHRERQPIERIGWDHVGDLNHANDLLVEVERFLGSAPATCAYCGGAVRGRPHVHPVV